MQSDTTFKFEEIHGSPEAMLVSIENIQKLALLREGCTSHRLRFLSLLDPQPGCPIQSGEVFLKLTPLGAILESYIAVSYTWDRLDSAPPSIPQYRIVNANNEVTNPPQGLNYVIHRSIRFASSKGIRLLWIDQLCVMQNDPEDIEMHLQCMHKVFEESDYTLVPLSCCISNTLLRTFECFLHIAPDKQKAETEVLEDVKTFLELFKFIVQDRWFKRAWTYQERRCSRNVKLAFHIVPGLGSGVLGDEYFTEKFVSFYEIQKAFKHLLMSGVPDLLKRGISDNAISIWSYLEHIMQFNFDFDSGSEYLPDFKSQVLTKQIFDIIETCGITVISDRLAILANLRKYIYRLKSTILSDSCFSYSTCVLVLLISNDWLELRTAHERMYFAVRMDATISEIIKTLANPNSGYIVSSEGTDGPKPIYVVDEDLKGRLPKLYVPVPILAIEELENLAFSSEEDCETGLSDLTRRLTRHESHRSMADTDSKLRWIEAHARIRREGRGA
jgi:hypothetical protein